MLVSKLMSSSGSMPDRHDTHTRAMDKYSTSTNFQVYQPTAKRPIHHRGMTIDQSPNYRAPMNVNQIRAASVMQVQTEQNRMALERQKKPRPQEKLQPMQINTVGGFYT